MPLATGPLHILFPMPGLFLSPSVARQSLQKPQCSLLLGAFPSYSPLESTMAFCVLGLILILLVLWLFHLSSPPPTPRLKDP